MSIMERPEALVSESDTGEADDRQDLDLAEPEFAPLKTLEEILLLPDDMKRDLIDGRLVEYPMTKGNRWHAHAESNLAMILGNWLNTQPEPRGQVLSGEAGFRLRRNPDTSFGIDVAYVSAEVLAATAESSPYIEGPPVLAVEILSPTTVHGNMVRKIRSYLDLGVRVVWIVDPDFKTVVVHRPGVEPELFNTTHELAGGEEMPGFQTRVAAIFA